MLISDLNQLSWKLESMCNGFTWLWIAQIRIPSESFSKTTSGISVSTCAPIKYTIHISATKWASLEQKLEIYKKNEMLISDLNQLSWKLESMCNGFT